MARPPRRPKPLTLGSYTVRAMGDPDTFGRYLWRLEWYPEGEGGKQRTRGLGRVVTAEVEAVAHAAVSELGSVKLPTRGEVTTWSILLRAALVAWRADAVAGDLADASIEVYEGAVARVLGVAEAWPLPEGPRALDAQVTALRDALLVAGWAPATARTALTVACKAWGWGVRQEVIAPVPWPRVRLIA